MNSLRSFGGSATLALLLLSTACRAVEVYNLNLTGTIRHTYPSHYYGLAFEEVYHAIDGGTNAQVLADPGLLADVDQNYDVINDQVSIAKDSTPLTSAITSTLKISAAAGASGRTGVINKAWGGFHPFHFNCTFFVQGDFDGDINIEVFDTNTGDTQYEKAVTVSSSAQNWTRVQANFVTNADQRQLYPSQWRVAFDASLIAGGSINLGYPTIIGPVYGGDDTGFSFRRLPNGDAFNHFPGGDNLLGTSPETRWKWNETIGALIDRPGRFGSNPYPSSDSFGLMEFLRYTEIADTTAILAIWSGLSLPGSGSSPLVGAALDPYVEDALAELEFILGDSSTPGGSLRAALGHPDPYSLSYVEIGNEDEKYGGCASYPQRFNQFYNAIHSAYPDLTIIASTHKRECLPESLDSGVMLDYHVRHTAKELAQSYHLFDDFDRSNSIYVRDFFKYSEAEIGDQKHPFTTVQQAASQAVFMLGLERNLDLVKMLSYGIYQGRRNYLGPRPTLQLIDWSAKNYNEISAVMQMYMLYEYTWDWIQGSSSLEVKSDHAPGPVYWSALSGHDLAFAVRSLRMVNAGADTVQIHISGLPDGWGCGRDGIQGAAGDVNNFDHQKIGDFNHPTKPLDGVHSFKLKPWETTQVFCSHT